MVIGFPPAARRLLRQLLRKARGRLRGLLPREGEERGLQRRDDRGQLADRDARAHQLRYQRVDRGDIGADHEHVRVRIGRGDGVHGHARRFAGDLTGGRGVAGAQPVIDRTALVGELAQRAGEDHPAGRDDGDLGAQRLKVVHLVAGQQHGGAVGREPAQHLVHVLAARRVQAVGRLVKDQQPGPDQQRGGEPDPLPHAEGEAANLVVGDIRQSDLRQGVVDVRLGAVAAQPGQFGEVAPRGQRGVDAGAVDEARDAIGHEQRSPGGLAKHLKGALVGEASPSRMPSSVVLPAPFGPTRPWICPAATSRSTPSSATTSPKYFVIPRPRTARVVLRSSSVSTQETFNYESGGTVDRDERPGKLSVS